MDPQATDLLNQAARGSEDAAARLSPLVYAELRQLADRYLGGSRGHTLQPTAVVHEAFLRLFRRDDLELNGQTHFLGMAAVAMRHVVLDHARDRARLKRGGGVARVTYSDTLSATGSAAELDALAIEEALQELARLDPRAGRVVELRFFSGLDDRAIGEALGVTDRTVRNDWRMARAWLRDRLADGEAGS